MFTARVQLCTYNRPTPRNACLSTVRVECIRPAAHQSCAMGRGISCAYMRVVARVMLWLAELTLPADTDCCTVPYTTNDGRHNSLQQCELLYHDVQLLAPCVVNNVSNTSSDRNIQPRADDGSISIPWPVAMDPLLHCTRSSIVVLFACTVKRQLLRT